MLEKLITNLKNSLPEPLRQKLGMGDESENESAEESEESVEDESENNDSDDSAELSAEEKKKKQVSMLIRVVVIVILAYLALDEFVLKRTTTEPTVDELLAKAPKRKRKEVIKPAESTVEETQTPATETPTEPAIAEAPPIENVNILDKAETAPEPQMQIESPATSEIVPEEIVETKVVDTSVDKKLDQLVENIEPTSQATEEVKIPSQETELVPETKKVSSMASKIVETATETAAPSYDQIGRGLVYNCKDKYWACLDKSAYVTCNKNMKWNKSKGNPMECVVQNIYNTDEDCAKVQKYNVSTSQPTEFCQ